MRIFNFSVMPGAYQHAERLIFSLWCLLVCCRQIIFCKKLTPGGSLPEETPPEVLEDERSVNECQL